MKGQWFIISAVIASSTFLGISFLLKDYFVVDASSPAQVNNDFYFYSASEQLNNIIKNTVTDDPPACINLTTNLNELKTIAEHELARRGLFMFMTYTIRDCSTTNIVDINLLVASQNEIIYNLSTTKASNIIG